ncbi:NADH dehydrogenase, putative [Trypanosoma brucei gambiense DAL972]|uniref:NADH dehydrogenase, putative n=2 Tax=Trypanosoma brucei TaxID=5691 RepID=D0A465_TRYB9|nr:NADH dehydrogenase, putative [Trypanosoma brucei gambiense DAL972]CBH16059.1 NADH dehydrogenase, putative [Trypanosoma brucei gambiense DAL972]|eukprot:XP_011778323.1 NADH dehydrogenase, putative [Trypanosoma brucei gambiense DAL972]
MICRTSFLRKPKVVVVGTGWAGCYFVRDTKPQLAELHVLSTRNHHVLTPLLPQTTTGTLEFRSICEPITRIQPALAHLPNRFSRCFVYDINFEQKRVDCISVDNTSVGPHALVNTFDVQYDKLVLAHGAQPNTFNVPGAVERACFLREVNEARTIRKRLVQNIMTANLPVTSVEEKKRLLHTVVVGGGPTGVEFSADLAEFLRDDVKNINPELVQFCKVTVLEAGEVFSTFDLRVREWGKRRLDALGVRIVKGNVVAVQEKEVITKSGEVFSTGLVVWSTGVGPSPLTKELKVDRTRQGRISVDEHLQVLRDGVPIPDVYAIGDCATNESNPLPTLAAVASRQGVYLAKKINAELAGKPFAAPFKYESLGSMVSLGTSSAVVELNGPRKLDFVGLKALFFWRSAYLSIVGSWRNRLYVIVNWLGSAIFGRDLTLINDYNDERTWLSLASEGAAREKVSRMNKVKTDGDGSNGNEATARSKVDLPATKKQNE